jgi:F-type H+-transporting ATPase subunit b
MMLFAAAGAENGWFIPADPKELYWGAAAFLVVVALLVWKVLPGVKQAMADRSARIRDELVEAERARVDAEAELASLRSKLGDSSAESDRILSEAREQADAVKADLIARADADAVDAREKAAVEVSASKGQAAADIQAEVAAQAAAAAESVVSANLDDATHSELINRYIEQVNS